MRPTTVAWLMSLILWDSFLNSKMLGKWEKLYSIVTKNVLLFPRKETKVTFSYHYPLKMYQGVSILLTLCFRIMF